MNFQMVETPFSLKLSIKKSQPKIYPQNMDMNHNQNFGFPPPGYPIAQPYCYPQVKVPPPEDDTKHVEHQEYHELKLEFESLKNSKEALEKDLGSTIEQVENFEKKTVELEKELLAFKTENNHLKDHSNDSVFDLDKSKRIT